MSTATITRAQTATIRLDEPRDLPLGDVIRDLQDVEAFVLLAEVLGGPVDAGEAVRAAATGEASQPFVISIRYGSPLEVVFGISGSAAAVIGALALAWERITAGVRNLKEASIKHSEASRNYAEAEKALAEAKRAHAEADKIRAGTALTDEERALQEAEALGRVRALNKMTVQLGAMGSAVADDRRAELKELVGEDLAQQFAEELTDEDLAEAIELFRRLIAKDATIEIDGG
ncbi:hypothetical protein [Agromyces sp. NPDC056965]|uniref:hypothetical protein n=1 Tax=Agromyces sp. NPDC056965 TaxID=3345983 RepID=UPI00362CFE7A